MTDQRTNPRAAVEARIAYLESIITNAEAEAARSDLSGIAYHHARQRAGAARTELAEKQHWMQLNASRYPDPAA